MEVFIYQIIIATIIIISGYSGKKAKNMAVVILALFTVTHIFMPWLMILQFVTIAISYTIATNIVNKKAEQKASESRNSPSNKNEETWGCTSIFGVIFLLFAILAIIYSFLSLLGMITGWFDVSNWV